MWVVRTLEDSFDGGNTYGAIYNYQRTQAIAHISDGDILCSNDWSKDDIAPKY